MTWSGPRRRQRSDGSPAIPVQFLLRQGRSTPAPPVGEAAMGWVAGQTFEHPPASRPATTARLWSGHGSRRAADMRGGERHAWDRAPRSRPPAAARSGMAAP